MMIFKQAAAGASALALDNTAAANTLPPTNPRQSTTNHRPHAREHRATFCDIATRTMNRRDPNAHTGNDEPRRYHRTVPTDQIRSHAWRTRRRELQQVINQGRTNCWRCNQPIPPHQPAAWDLGHTRDRANGGTIGETRPECTDCNRSAGGRLGAARRWQPTPLPSRAL